MKKSIPVFILFLLLLPFLIPAQTIYGWNLDGPYVPGNPNAVPVYMAKLDSASGTTVNQVLVASSSGALYPSFTFDHENNSYVYVGLDKNQVARIYSIKTDSSGISEPVLTQLPDAAIDFPELVEYDLAVAETYALQRMNYGISFVRVNLQTGQVIEIDTLQGVYSMVNLASTFDSNHHRYIFQGKNAPGDSARIYFVDAATGQISKSIPALTPDFDGGRVYANFEYDNNTDQLFGYYSIETSSNNFAMYIGEIDTSTGIPTSLLAGPIAQGPFVGNIYGTNDLDQGNRIYYTGIVQGNGKRIVTVDLDSGAVLTNLPYDGELAGMQVDNSAFAASRYNTATSTASPISHRIQIFPNPAHNQVRIRWEGLTADRLAVYSISGQQLLQQDITGLQELNLALRQYDAGMYFIQFSQQGHVIAREKLLRLD